MPEAGEKDLTRYVVWRLESLRTELGDRKKGKQIAWRPLGEILGVAHSTLMDVHAGKKTAGPSVERAFIERDAKGDRGKFDRIVKAWVKANPEEPDVRQRGAGEHAPVMGGKARYPNLEKLLDKHPRRWSAPAIAAAREFQGHAGRGVAGDRDYTMADWAQHLDRLEVAITTASRLGGDPLEGLE